MTDLTRAITVRHIEADEAASRRFQSVGCSGVKSKRLAKNQECTSSPDDSRQC